MVLALQNSKYNLTTTWMKNCFKNCVQCTYCVMWSIMTMWLPASMMICCDICIWLYWLCENLLSDKYWDMYGLFGSAYRSIHNRVYEQSIWIEIVVWFRVYGTEYIKQMIFFRFFFFFLKVFKIVSGPVEASPNKEGIWYT